MLQVRSSEPRLLTLERCVTRSYNENIPLLPFLAQVHELLLSYPVSIALQRLELIERGMFDDLRYYISIGIKLIGSIDRDILEIRFNKLIKSLALECSTLSHLTLSVVNLVGLSIGEQVVEVQRLKAEELRRLFGVEHAQFVHIRLLRLGENVHMLLLMLPHCISDITTAEELMRELTMVFCMDKGRAQRACSSKITLARNDYTDCGVDVLTARELEVLQYIAEGLSNREIAQRCFITEGTVKRHTNNIYSKLDVVSRTHAVAKAKSLQLLP